MPDKNLIGLNQLRQNQISGYINRVASGLFATFGSLTGASGSLLASMAVTSGVLYAQMSGISGAINKTFSGFSVNVPSGANDLNYYWTGAFPSIPKMSFDLKCPNTSEGHLIEVYPISGYVTGAYVYFSNTIPTNGYVLDILAKV